MDTQRLILLAVFGVSLLMLWEAWERDHRPAPAFEARQQQTAPQGAVPTPAKPTPPAAGPRQGGAGSVPGSAAAPHSGETVTVRTDLVEARLDTLGATLTHLALLKQKATGDSDQPFVLLDPEFHYEAQSGLTGEAGPNHRSLWRLEPGARSLAAGQDTLEVRFSATGANGVEVTKVYRFKRNSYVIDVSLEIRNVGGAPVTPYGYFQLTHNGEERGNGNKVASSFGARSFHGFAVYSEEHKFQKVPVAEIDKNKADYVKQAKDGWLAYVQHYFVSAWMPPAGESREYTLEKHSNGVYAGRAVIAAGTLAPGASKTLTVPLYAGPQEHRRLEAAAPGLELVVDYGWLTIVAWPLFWLLEKYHALSGNWGVAIILLTVTVKLVFFPLSATSYKSMAKMKLVAPRLQKIREMYEQDRARMNQAMMELYKTEKINPLGGCFPILIQIPVFIALYWVLLAAIELRHAPFILWIHDLSAQDPYYVLPALMTVTMFIQTRMNPTPPDPVQAKIMQFMPFVFSVFFFFFPAGLVLYWLCNNILSILQQWQIQRMFNRDKPAHAKR
ncbi:MAG TPA: membrane protein insertase YidC [Burkholderiales bacterium]|nr:membrane protein insertase YidC [Burkholderiales bacterium]